MGVNCLLMGMRKLHSKYTPQNKLPKIKLPLKNKYQNNKPYLFDNHCISTTKTKKISENNPTINHKTSQKRIRLGVALQYGLRSAFGVLLCCYRVPLFFGLPLLYVAFMLPFVVGLVMVVPIFFLCRILSYCGWLVGLYACYCCVWWVS